MYFVRKSLLSNLYFTYVLTLDHMKYKAGHSHFAITFIIVIQNKSIQTYPNCINCHMQIKIVYWMQHF